MKGGKPVYQSRQPLTDKLQTSNEIKSLVNEFADDLEKVSYQGPGGNIMKFSDMSLSQFFNYVRNIPYRRDPSRPTAREVISRPYYLLKHSRLGLDCKKKAILIASWLKLHGIPFRFIGSSERQDKKVHHIFPQALIDGEWKNTDATYHEYKLFEPKKISYAEIL